MDSVEGKVAIITGAASGMGRAFAEKFGAEGATIVAADVEEPVLNETVEALRGSGIEASAHVVDVSNVEAMETFAAEVFEVHPEVHLLFNNAGVGGGGRFKDLTASDWDWVLGVNLYGVAHGLRLFLPNMIDHGDGHVINTASVAGHTAMPGLGIYNATKHAVVAISETLFAELAEDAPGIGVSVLCPGIVNTRILESGRNRPEQLLKDEPEPTEEELAIRELVEARFAVALAPSAVADLVYDAVLERQFYIFTDDEFQDAITARHASIANRTNPILGPRLVAE